MVDPTTIDGVEAVNAAIPLEGRAVPVAWIDFPYHWKTLIPASQNAIERYLLTWLREPAPPRVRLILIFDRGYARVALIQDLNRGRHPFLLRARSKVIVEACIRGRRQRISLNRLQHRTGQPIRYSHVLYHRRAGERVDAIVYRQKGFQDAWFLVVPPDSEAWLATAEVVALYRQRMQIEQCFRDWKSHLRLRGLQLRVHKQERLLRLLSGFTLAYLLVLLLGRDPLAQKLRPFFEVARRRPRHSTKKILSALSIALYLLADPRWSTQALQRFRRILSRLANGRSIALLTAFSP